MGVSYSQPRMKTQLTMASQRLTMMINKQNNALRVEQKAVASLLSAEKEESGRIKTEGIILQKNLILAMEMIQLMCDLLKQRLSLLTTNKICPPDLEESLSTVIYASKHIECPELTEIGRMCAAKFGEDWARAQLNNVWNRVNTKVIKLTSVHPPPFEVVIEEMKSIANQFNVEWTPSLEKDDDEKDQTKEHQKLGSIAPIKNNNQEKKDEKTPTNIPASVTGNVSAASAVSASSSSSAPKNYPPPAFSSITPIGSSSSSSSSFNLPSGISRYPGTANIVIHEGKELYAHTQTRSDVYIRVASQSSGMSTSWKSSVCHFASFGIAPKWNGEHFPIPVHDEGDRLLLELHMVYGDGVIGYSVIPIEDITILSQPKWYPLQRDQSGAYAGAILLSAQYLPLHAPNPGAFISDLNSNSNPVPSEHVPASNFKEMNNIPDEPQKPAKTVDAPVAEEDSSSHSPGNSSASSAISSSSSNLPSIDDLEKRFQQLKED